MKRLFAGAALAALAACQGSDPQPLELVFRDPFVAGVSRVSGGGASDLLAYTRYHGDGTYGVRLLRHDAASPDELQLLGDVEMPTDRLFVTGGFAVGCPGCELVDLTNPALPRSTVPVPLPQGVLPGALAIDGRWLLAASGTALQLVDLEGGPGASFTTSTPVAAVIATQGRFLAFEASGYVHVVPDATAPTFSEVQSENLRGVAAAFADGAQAVVAGPSPNLGKSRVMRLDLSTPAAPTVVRSHEVPVEFGYFAWDGATLGIVAAASVAGQPMHQGYAVHEVDGAFTSAGIPLPQQFTLYDPTAIPIAAHAGRLFAADYYGFGMYRVKR
jgi:hypothetical protein